MAGRTTIVITHDLAVAREADDVLVLDPSRGQGRTRLIAEAPRRKAATADALSSSRQSWW